jgi:predicted phosphoribosyltransferase
MNPLVYANRREAGAALAAELSQYRGRGDVVVLALPRGGVPVGYEVARALEAPLDVFVVRKLGAPGHRELAMGAIASGGVRVLNRDVIGWYGISPAAIEATAREELAELERRERAYREGRGGLDLKGRTVILVDDGLATGSTMKAAVQAIRERGPARIVVAAPVGAPQTCNELQELADEVVCARTPDDFAAVGQWYVDFSQTGDSEVCELLRESADAHASH